MPEIGHGRDLFGPENLLLKQPVVLLEIMRRFSSPSVPPRPECVLAREMNPVNIASDHIRQYPAGQSHAGTKLPSTRVPPSANGVSKNCPPSDTKNPCKCGGSICV